MFTFHILRSLKDIFGHIILILIPVLLIIFFNYIFGNLVFQNSIGVDRTSYMYVLIIGFSLTFQIYGGSLSFEPLALDFFTPMHDRLLATSVTPRSITLSVLFTGFTVSFLQTVAIFIAAASILHISIPGWPLVAIVMLVSVMVHQLLGTVILFLSKTVKTANAVITAYGIVAPMTIGLYFPLPEGSFTEIMRRYLSPVAWANTASLAAIQGNLGDLLIGIIPLIALAIVLFIVLQPLLKRIAA